jgi:hypothetical protein
MVTVQRCQTSGNLRDILESRGASITQDPTTTKESKPLGGRASRGQPWATTTAANTNADEQNYYKTTRSAIGATKHPPPKQTTSSHSTSSETTPH